jgi:hypothetical protein
MSTTAGPVVKEVKDFVGTPMTYMTRVVGSGNTAYQQADISSITVQVWDAGGTETLSVTALDKTATVFDTLQTTALDAEWTEDTTGYNFKYTVPASAFQAVSTHKVNFVFTPVTGSAQPIKVIKITLPLDSSLPL